VGVTPDPAAPHPVAPVPDRLFDDEREERWRARFTAPRMSRPAWAEDAPDRCVYTSNATGTTEVHVWDRASGEHRQVTDRRSGTHSAVLPPDGEHVWWFADTDGDEFGHWVAEPFTGGGAPEPAVPGVATATPPGWRSGARSPRRARPPTTAPRSGCGGTRARRRWSTGHAEDAGVHALSEDETLLAIGHAEHGDSRHPALRVLRVADGSTVAEKHDGPGRGLTALAFAPVAGDPRLLVLHERHGREELLVWDVLADTETELHLDLPGEVVADWTPDAAGCSSGTPTPPAPGCTATTWRRASCGSCPPPRGAWARPTPGRTAPSSTAAPRRRSRHDPGAAPRRHRPRPDHAAG
jgi:hypothetical protein